MAGGILEKIAYKLNGWMRKTDFWVNRAFGGRLQSWVRVEGHAPLILLWTGFLIVILLLGPTPRIGLPLVFLAIAAATVVVCFLARRWPRALPWLTMVGLPALAVAQLTGLKLWTWLTKREGPARRRGGSTPTCCSCC